MIERACPRTTFAPAEAYAHGPHRWTLDRFGSLAQCPGSSPRCRCGSPLARPDSLTAGACCCCREVCGDLEQCRHCGHSIYRPEGEWIDVMDVEGAQSGACLGSAGHEPMASDSHASVSPEQTPSPAEKSPDNGDHSTVGETP